MIKEFVSENKTILVSITLSAGLILAAIFISVDRNPSGTSQVVANPDAPAGSEEKFNYLANQISNTCGLQQDDLSSIEGGRIQGSCCAPMNLHAYQEQVEGLRKYSKMSVIPSDPYDVSAEQARLLLGFQRDITLTSDQLKTYDQAAKISKEGGPCCCKCWHWDAYGGLAKKLIVDYDWGAEQIAELWDLSDACGGEDHLHNG